MTTIEVREKACPQGHPLSRSVRWGVSKKWVCRDCRNLRTTKYRARPEVYAALLERQRQYKATLRATQKDGVQEMPGYPPRWEPGLGQCSQDHDNPDWITKPTAETEYLLATCNGRQGLPRCPMRAKCLSWAKGQKNFEGVAGGQMFYEGRIIEREAVA